MGGGLRPIDAAGDQKKSAISPLSVYKIRSDSLRGDGVTKKVDSSIVFPSAFVCALYSRKRAQMSRCSFEGQLADVFFNQSRIVSVVSFGFSS